MKKIAGKVLARKTRSGKDLAVKKTAGQIPSEEKIGRKMIKLGNSKWKRPARKRPAGKRPAGKVLSTGVLQ